jgi:CheY-like chemotaxis protein
MPRVLVDCGNCGPDFNSIRQMVKTYFGAIVLQTHGAEDTLELLKKQPVDLVTVNRKLDRDYTDGLEVIRRLKADPMASQIPVMLITNYEEHQQQAMAEGAVLGFGKLSLGEPSTRERLLPYLKEVARESRE